MLRLIHTIAGIERSHGGPSRSVPVLCESLSLLDQEVHLVTGRPADRGIAVNPPPGPTQIHWIDESPLTGRLFTGRCFRKVLGQIIAVDPGRSVIHDHGMWLPSNHAAAMAACEYGVPRVISTRGMLSPWSLNRQRMLKAVVWRLRQRTDLLNATAFHATSQIEVDQIRSAGLTQPIALIPNGIRFSEATQPSHQDGTRQLLFLSRMHPIKGVENLLRAFQLAHPSNDWELSLVGPSESNFRERLVILSKQLGISHRVRFHGEVSDQEKWAHYGSADLFVLPSQTENFGISIAEALAAGVPVITTQGTPWSELIPRGAGWWVQATVDDLAKAIHEATLMSRSELLSMGARGSEWVRAEFTWDSIAQRMQAFYRWLVSRDNKPAFVT